MLTRSVGETIVLARAVFEQPPSSTRRDSAKHPVRKTKPNTKTTLKVFGPSTGYRFFWCSRTPLLWWASSRLMQQRFRKNAFFVAQNTPWSCFVESDLPGFDHKNAHTSISVLAGRTGRKQGTYMWGGTLVFSANMSQLHSKIISSS